MVDRMGERVKARLSAALAVVGLIAALVSLSYAVARNADSTRRINQERARNIRATCEDVNHRHDATLDQLDSLIRHLPDGPKKDRALQGRAATVLLINALVPKRDCDSLASRQVSAQ